jgi:hypothetical protein
VINSTLNFYANIILANTMLQQRLLYETRLKSFWKIQLKLVFL